MKDEVNGSPENIGFKCELGNTSIAKQPCEGHPCYLLSFTIIAFFPNAGQDYSAKGS